MKVLVTKNNNSLIDFGVDVAYECRDKCRMR